MIPKPTTRDQARTNAILAAEDAEMNMVPGGIAALASGQVELSKAWSAIAQTFPDPDTYEIRGDDRTQYVIPVPPFALSESERDTVEHLREGSLVTVHPDYILEHMALVRSQFRVEPGYVGMAVTPEEQRTVMAMRSGARPEDTTQTLPIIQVPGSEVRVPADFHAVLTAIAVATINSNLADDGVVTIYVEDIEAAKAKNVLMTSCFNNGGPPYRVWLTESGA